MYNTSNEKTTYHFWLYGSLRKSVQVVNCAVDEKSDGLNKYSKNCIVLRIFNCLVSCLVSLVMKHLAGALKSTALSTLHDYYCCCHNKFIEKTCKKSLCLFNYIHCRPRKIYRHHKFYTLFQRVAENFRKFI